MNVVPDVYSKIDSKYNGVELIQAEQQIFGVTHQEIGLESAHSWGLPKDVKSAIGYHHCPGDAPVHCEFAKIVGTANDLALAWGIGAEPVGDSDIDNELADGLKIDREELDSIREAASESYLEVSQSLGGAG